jgi:hypothetical protein
MQTDIAVIKERQTTIATLRDTVTKLEGKVTALESRNLKQDGAMGMMEILKQFGPWILSLLVLAWGLFQRKPL